MVGLSATHMNDHLLNLASHRTHTTQPTCTTSCGCTAAVQGTEACSCPQNHNSLQQPHHRPDLHFASPHHSSTCAPSCISHQHLTATGQLRQVGCLAAWRLHVGVHGTRIHAEGPGVYVLALHALCQGHVQAQQTKLEALVNTSHWLRNQLAFRLQALSRGCPAKRTIARSTCCTAGVTAWCHISS
jgi:hypothetical protein